LGYWGKSYLAAGPVLRILAGIILVLMGLYLADIWRALVVLEKAGSRLWRLIQPLGTRLLPVSSMAKAFGLGMVWGWLPCGLVYSALAYAAASANIVDGMLSMAAFGLGTAPAMVVGGVFSGSMKQFLQARLVRLVMALLMIGFGVWTLSSAMSHLQHASSSPGQQHHEMQHHH